MRENSAEKQYEDIKAFVSGTVAEGSPIIPISAQLKYNIDVICDYISRIPIPLRDFTCNPRLIIVRSFDVNKPGEEIENLRGGVAGGSLLQGVLRVGDNVEIKPGIVKKQDGKIQCNPILSRIVSLQAEDNDLLYAVPGGLIGVGMKVDPTLTRSDHLTGHVLGRPGQLPNVLNEIEITFYLLRRLLGKKSEGGRAEKVSKLKKGETLLVNIGSTSTGGRVTGVKGDMAKISLNNPVCASVGEKIALSRRIEKNFR